MGNNLVIKNYRKHELKSIYMAYKSSKINNNLSLRESSKKAFLLYRKKYMVTK